MKIYLQSSVDFLIEKSVTDFQARPASSGALEPTPYASVYQMITN